MAKFTDAYTEMLEHEHFSQQPTEADALTARILNTVRRANITVSPPAHIAPPVWQDPIDQSAQVSVAAAVGAYATAATFTCPEGRWARIESYGVQVLDNTYTYGGSILWRFQLNGRPLGYGLSDWGEQRGSLPNPRKTYIILQEDDVLNFQVRRAVAAGAPQDVQMGFSGWSWRLRMNYEGTSAAVTSW